jgi:hypothetical protein
MNALMKALVLFGHLLKALVLFGHLISWGVILCVPLVAMLWLLLGCPAPGSPYPMWDILAAILIVVFLYAATSIQADNPTEPAQGAFMAAAEDPLWVRSLGDAAGVRARSRGLRHARMTAALNTSNGDVRAAQTHARGQSVR